MEAGGNERGERNSRERRSILFSLFLPLPLPSLPTVSPLRRFSLWIFNFNRIPRELHPSRNPLQKFGRRREPRNRTDFDLFRRAGACFKSIPRDPETSLPHTRVVNFPRNRNSVLRGPPSLPPAAATPFCPGTRVPKCCRSVCGGGLEYRRGMAWQITDALGNAKYPMRSKRSEGNLGDAGNLIFRVSSELEWWFFDCVIVV